MPANTPTPAKIDGTRVRLGFWARNSWKLLLGLVAVIGIFGLGDIIWGLDADPAIAAGVSGFTPDEIRASSAPLHRLVDLQTRAGGLQLLVIASLWTTLVVIPLRRGDRWAWYAMWSFPLWALAVSVTFLLVELQPDQPTPPPAISGWIFFALTSVLLWAARPSKGEEPASDG